MTEIIEVVTIKEVSVKYYGAVVTYDGYYWFGTSILEKDAADATRRASEWGEIKEFRIFSIELITKIDVNNTSK